MASKNSFTKHTKPTDISSLLLSRKAVCKLLSFSMNELRKHYLTDELFPKRIKKGPSKQSGVKFKYKDILEWHLRDMERHKKK